VQLTYSYTDFGYILVLEPGDEVVRTLIQFAREQEVEYALLSGTGGVAELELGAGGGRGMEHCRTHVAEPLEACSLTGALTLVDGEPFPHLHGSFARPDATVVGGHVYQAVCSTSVELAVHVGTARAARSNAVTPTFSKTRTGT
jgi:predicted DNA-binding protein with PD1-like motif